MTVYIYIYMSQRNYAMEPTRTFALSLRKCECVCDCVFWYLHTCRRAATHWGPPRCRFLRRPEESRNQVQLFLRPLCLSLRSPISSATMSDMSRASLPKPLTHTLNPDSVTGHRQPIKPGLVGHPHTALQRESFLTRLARPLFTHGFSLFHSLNLSRFCIYPTPLLFL